MLSVEKSDDKNEDDDDDEFKVFHDSN